MILLAITLVIASNALAVEIPQMNLIPIAADKAIVAFANNKPSKFELTVQTADGDIVYYKQTTKAATAYKTLFDFGNLENGNYLLNVKMGNKEIKRTFSVSNSGIRVGKSQLRFDPHFNFADNQLKFSFLNFEKESFGLYIYNQDQELVYKSKLGSDFAMTSGLDLGKLEEGNYEVLLKSYNQEFSYRLEK